MGNIWIFYCTWNVRLHVFWQMPYRRTTHLRMLLLEYRWFNRLISDPLWMEQRRSQIRKSGFGFFGFQIQRILFEKGFTRSKIRFWIRRKEHTLDFEQYANQLGFISVTTYLSHVFTFLSVFKLSRTRGYLIPGSNSCNGSLLLLTTPCFLTDVSNYCKERKIKLLINFYIKISRNLGGNF